MLTGKASGAMCRLGEGQGAGVAQKRHEAGVGFEPIAAGVPQSDLRGEYRVQQRGWPHRRAWCTYHVHTAGVGCVEWRKGADGTVVSKKRRQRRAIMRAA